MTLVRELTEERANPKVVKAVLDESENARYFSRISAQFALTRRAAFACSTGVIDRMVIDDVIEFLAQFHEAEDAAVRSGSPPSVLSSFFVDRTAPALYAYADPAPRKIFLVKQYKHASLGQAFLCWVSSNQASASRYKSILIVGEDRGSPIIVGELWGCGACETTGDWFGAACEACEGTGGLRVNFGWGPNNGWDAKAPGTLVAVRGVNPPGHPTQRRHYDQALTSPLRVE